MSENKGREEVLNDYIDTDQLYKIVNSRHKNTLIVGFRTGYDSRDPEVAELKAEIKRLNERIDRDAEKFERYGE